jgi:hypothetical protein
MKMQISYLKKLYLGKRVCYMGEKDFLEKNIQTKEASGVL